MALNSNNNNTNLREISIRLIVWMINNREKISFNYIGNFDIGYPVRKFLANKQNTIFNEINYLNVLMENDRLLAKKYHQMQHTHQDNQDITLLDIIFDLIKNYFANKIIPTCPDFNMDKFDTEFSNAIHHMKVHWQSDENIDHDLKKQIAKVNDMYQKYALCPYDNVTNGSSALFFNGYFRERENNSAKNIHIPNDIRDIVKNFSMDSQTDHLSCVTLTLCK